MNYDENTSRISSGGKNERNNLLQAQKAKSRCQPDKLSKLKSKCETIVRFCILGLLLEMSDQAFTELEGRSVEILPGSFLKVFNCPFTDEMNKAVCWYLTCDRYWEDNNADSQLFPWGLILVFTFVLSLGVCFCYYIIWILFEYVCFALTICSTRHI